MTTSIVDDQSPTNTTTLTRSHTYDDYGRPASTTYPSSVKVAREYNDRGYLAKLMHGATVLVNVTEQTAYGQSKTVSYGNGVQTERSYDELGRLKGIDTTRGAVKIQDNTYAWRSDGSLESRIAGAAGSRSKREESFGYDYLNRLTRATTHISDSATASRTLTFDYDLRGNLETKTSDVSADDSVTNIYPTTSNRLSSATIGDVPYTFPHDTSGHIEQYDCTDEDGDAVDDCADVDDTFIGWNARGLAEKVTVGDSGTDAMPAARDSFRYGPDGMRYFKKSDWSVTSGGTTTLKTSRKYYAGAYEKTVTVGGDTVERTRIGDAVVHVRTTPAGMMATQTSAFEYVHRDHLGSVEAVTDASGNELVVLGYDPYGERRKNDWTGQLADIESLLSAHGERVSRGFTRHEHLDRTGLIHMNGRMYDPRLGRFLSPDPIVGDPTSSQSWNFYSYVGNNPLSYVDPTGLNPLDGGCGWLCPDDIDAWWDWLNFLYSWWDYPHSGSDYYDGASDPYSELDYESTGSKAEKTLRATDHSVAEEPADSTDGEESFLDKIFEAIENEETSIPLEEILGPVLEKATDKTLEEVRARGDVILSDVVVSGGKATGSFENTGTETGIPLEKGRLILDEKIGGAFEVSATELVLVKLEGMVGSRWGVSIDLDDLSIDREGNVEHNKGRKIRR